MQSVMHVPRVQNAVAHSLAKFALSSLTPQLELRLGFSLDRDL